MTIVNPIRVQKYLNVEDFPLDKNGVIDCARDNGADEKVIDTLNQLPDMTYQTPVDVSEAIRDLDEESGDEDAPGTIREDEEGNLYEEYDDEE